MTLKIDNDYADGYSASSTETVTLPTPDDMSEDGLDEWADEHLISVTGTNTGRDNVDACYTVKVIACEALPELVNYEKEWA